MEVWCEAFPARSYDIRVGGEKVASTGTGQEVLVNLMAHAIADGMIVMGALEG